jgi:hypothetical protein
MMTPHTRPILERLAYACYLATLGGSLAVLWISGTVHLETGNELAMGLAFVGLALSRWLHLHGYAHWHFRECEDSLEVSGASGVIPRSEEEEARVAELVVLLAQMEAEPDVWRRGELRREIAARLAATPGLRAEFAETLAAHPGI